MTSHESELIRYRVERSFETLQEAQLLLDAGHCKASVNRLYYACFYAVSALLLTEGLSSSKHSGTKALFEREWVKTKRVSQEVGKTFRTLYENRQEADYVDFARFEETVVRGWIEEATSALEILRQEIEKLR